ncbi:uncharacterized protein CCOS01_16199 [Colletotrichum costaricense]|uniref:Uncharacterized protein n=1 Tax=Colletotrichum costaricense TaxID=1209916 RepID=A0AAI9YGG6_9PEZI|nr:uncharacterized protein CCOS01_16199 [Colletotrichum costaricense]KAK1507893.1 hypothetical protein CCOS01_16199 [Colletotrichum costaricense]
MFLKKVQQHTSAAAGQRTVDEQTARIPTPKRASASSEAKKAVAFNDNMWHGVEMAEISNIHLRNKKKNSPQAHTKRERAAQEMAQRAAKDACTERRKEGEESMREEPQMQNAGWVGLDFARLPGKGQHRLHSDDILVPVALFPFAETTCKKGFEEARKLGQQHLMVAGCCSSEL